MSDRTCVKMWLMLLVCSLLLLACSPVPPAQTPPPTPTPGPLDLIKGLEASMNQGDTDAALELFVDQGLDFTLWGASAEDKEGLRFYLDFFVGVGHPEDGYRDCQSEGDTVTCILETYDGICLEAFGMEVMHYRVAFKFQDHRIRSVLGDIVSEEKPGVEAAIRKKNTWLAANRPEKYRALQDPISSALTGREWAELDLELCRDYLEASSG